MSTAQITINQTLSNLLKFENRFTRELLPDCKENNARRQVSNCFYSWVEPKQAGCPTLIAYAKEVSQMLGLPEKLCLSNEFVSVFSGNVRIKGSRPYATRYGGHQFGHWAGQLGDGRAIYLGEVKTQKGEFFELQLKGAGPTPYSRRGDGLAVLRSSLREFICSEAMHHLGIPTTRALSLIGTGEQVVRDMLYDGNVRPEPGAVVCRVAPSFLRFGHFEILAAQGETRELKALTDFTIRSYFQHIGAPSKETYLLFFKEVCDRTMNMILHWTRVGFVHGVMNTDNMSILGLTIDYGPYGWLDSFDPDWTPNTTDAERKRYRFGHQSSIAIWNLLQFATSLLPLVDDPIPFEAILKETIDAYEEIEIEMYSKKLGFSSSLPEDQSLIKDCLDILQMRETDMTIFYRKLAEFNLEQQLSEEMLCKKIVNHFQESYYSEKMPTKDYLLSFAHWLEAYRIRYQKETGKEQRIHRMNKINPKYIPRNYLTQLAIDKAEEKNYKALFDLLEVIRCPYGEGKNFERSYAQKRPDWARNRLGCSALSCSS